MVNGRLSQFALCFLGLPVVRALPNTEGLLDMGMVAVASGLMQLGRAEVLRFLLKNQGQVVVLGAW